MTLWMTLTGTYGLSSSHAPAPVGVIKYVDALAGDGARRAYRKVLGPTVSDVGVDFEDEGKYYIDVGDRKIYS